MNKTAAKYSEYSIQDWLYHFSQWKNHESQITNIYLYAWESDFISITRAGLVHEYEIKISRADFKHDFAKEEKHLAVHAGIRQLSWFQYPREERDGMLIGQIKKENVKTEPTSRPNYFWYVCPPGIIPLDDIPKYAGLIYVDHNDYQCKPLRDAPRLHPEHIEENKLKRITRSYGFKYWSLRNSIAAEIAQASAQHQAGQPLPTAAMP